MRAEFPGKRFGFPTRRARQKPRPASARVASGEKLEDRALLSQTAVTLDLTPVSDSDALEVASAAERGEPIGFTQLVTLLEASDRLDLVAAAADFASFRLADGRTFDVARSGGTGFEFNTSMSADELATGRTLQVIGFGNDILIPLEPGDDFEKEPAGTAASGDAPDLTAADAAPPLTIAPAQTSHSEYVAVAIQSGVGPRPDSASAVLLATPELTVPGEAESALSTAVATEPASLIPVPLPPVEAELAGGSVAASLRNGTSSDGTFSGTETSQFVSSLTTTAAPSSGTTHETATDAVADVPLAECRTVACDAAFVPATLSHLVSPVSMIVAGLAAAADTVARTLLVALGADAGSDAPSASIIDPVPPALDAAAVAQGAAPKWALGRNIDELLDFSRVTIVNHEAAPNESAPVGPFPEAGLNGVLAVQLEMLPQHGELLEIAGRLGQFRYTADPGFSGIDTFSYLVVTPGGDSSRGVVSLVVPEPAEPQLEIGRQAEINLNNPRAQDLVIELAQSSSETASTSETAIDESFRQVDDWADEF